MNRFNNDDFDGVVLEIPMGVIATNPELISAMESFKKVLMDCKFSTMHPLFPKEHQ